MSFQEDVDEGDYMSGAAWDNTCSESILEESDTHDERTFLDDVNERIDLDEEQYGFVNSQQLELRASTVLDGYALLFPADSTLDSFASIAPNPFPTEEIQNLNNRYQQGPAGCNPEYEQHCFDANGASNASATYKDSTKTDWPTQNRTRHRLGAQRHEPQGRIPETAQIILRAFFNRNPNPTLRKKESLAHVTELTTSQVDTWFEDTRSLEVLPSASSLSTFPDQSLPYFEQYQGNQQYAHHSGCSGSGYTPINTDASSTVTCLPGPHRSVGEHGRQSPSLEAYQNTPPRDDAPPVTVSENVIGFRINRALPPILEDATPMGRAAGSSESWVNVRQGVDSESHSMSRESTRMSSASNPNIADPSTTPGRQGKPKVNNQNFSKARSDRSRIYQCLWCYHPFKTPSGMRRHMVTQHTRRDIYICMRDGLSGLRVLDPLLNRQICILCHSAETDDDHFRSRHNALPCIEKDHGKRTYYREDQFTRHIKASHDKGKHGLPGLSRVVKEWKNPPLEGRWCCGFCPVHVNGWKEFISHLAKHFEGGCDMTSWIDLPAGSNGYLF